MDNYKDEGKITRANSGDIALDHKSHFNDGADDQIAAIEKQLKKAQNTLLDLQSLKEKLELERERSAEREKQEQERINAKKLKEENKQLKDELKDYQGEINSLKGIIASLKDDLVSTTATLQSKVADSLKILESAESKIDQQGSLVAQKANELERSEHHYNNVKNIKKEEEDEEPIILDEPKKYHTQETKSHDSEEDIDKNKIDQQAPNTNITPADNAGDNVQQPAVTVSEIIADGDKSKEIIEVTETANPETATTEAANVAAPVAPATASENTLVAPSSSQTEVNQPVQTTNHAEVTPSIQQAATPVSQVETKPNETQSPTPAIANSDNIADSLNNILTNTSSNNSVDTSADELSEYEKIKQELEALERGDITIAQETPAQEKEIPSQKLETLKAEIVKEVPQQQSQNSAQPTAPTESGKAEAPKNESMKIAWKGNDPYAKKSKSSLAEKLSSLSPFKKKKIEEAIRGDVHTAPIVAPNQSQGAAIPTAPAPSSAQPAVLEVKQVSEKEKAKLAKAEAKKATQEKKAQEQLAKTEAKKAEKEKKEKEKLAKAEAKKAEKSKEKDNHHKGGIGSVMIKTAIFALIVTSSFLTYRIKNASTLREMYVSQAKQNSINSAKSAKEAADDGSSLNTPPEEKYKEAYANVSIDQTQWQDFVDEGIGIKYKYPINATHKLKTLSSPSTWILRKDGYLMKYEVIDTTLSLEDYIKSLNPKIVYKTEVMTFKGKVAVKLTPEEKLPIEGDTFVLQGRKGIIKIWYRTYDAADAENADDKLRVEKMVESLEFTF